MEGIDGDDLQDASRPTLERYCRLIDVPFDDAMLEWDDGRVREWRPDEKDSQAKWHHTLERSSSFIRTTVPPVVPTSEQRRMLATAERIYTSMFEGSPVGASA